MFNKLLHIAIYIFLGKIIFSQNHYEHLDVNNIKARFDANGFLFYSESYALPGLVVPHNSGRGILNIGNLWISGKNKTSGGVLAVAANTYANDYRSWFKHGPIANQYPNIYAPGAYSGIYDSLYNYVFKISRTEILNHLANYNNTGYIMPWAISNWPGNGNASLGISQQLAPYVDINGNGIYEPHLGEYPRIKGDQCLYLIFNDDRVFQTLHHTQANKFGFEIHLMAYANYTIGFLDNTIFLNYTVFNRSDNHFDDVRFGLWFDKCVGCFENTHEGCDTTLNSFFVYKNHSPEQDCNLGYGSGYGAFPPALGLTFLNQKMTGFGVYENNFAPTGNPESPLNIDSYLKSKFKDNTAFKNDCDYYGGIDSTKFIFHDDPNDPTGVSAINCLSFAPHNVSRMLGVIGPFNIPARSSVCFDVAVSYAQDIGGNHLSSVTQLKNYIQSVQTFFNNQNWECSVLSPTGNSYLIQTPNLKLYPNPVSDYLQLEVNTKSGRISIFNTIGKEVLSFQLDEKQQNILLATDKLSDGIYFIKVDSGNQMAVSKFIKKSY